MTRLRKETTVPCKVKECDRVADGARGWCWAHYMRWYSSGQEPIGPVASQRSKPERCSVRGCTRDARIGQWCAPHGKRARRNGGDPGQAEIQAKAGNGKGKTRYKSNGYWWLRMPDHPNAYANGCVQEHTAVMSNLLGRPLINGENVHHKNGVKTDNRPENLELWVIKQPKGQRAVDLVAWAREILDRYGDYPAEILG